MLPQKKTNSFHSLRERLMGLLAEGVNFFELKKIIQSQKNVTYCDFENHNQWRPRTRRHALRAK